MPSQFPGFEFDIFISYRHNDNLDGWVTEFVSNLDKELKATLKEPVSIYFDKNPHDGLLESHLVDKSLEGKLKCLIFIPVLSQTYCDPKSFAWQHEFCAFNKLTSTDSFGRHIRLLSGNVASRILPIKIHDLDSDDHSILEQELGNTLRSIEFIYQEPGVNRPLKPTDSRAENHNKTDYRNQINKVANAIKEIYMAIHLRPVQIESSQVTPPTTSIRRRKTLTYTIWASLLLALVLGWQVWPSLYSDRKSARIAILPFLNNTGSSEYDFYGVGIASDLRTNLSLSKKFDFVSSLHATLQYQNTDKSIVSIGEELGVNYILTGLYRSSGSRLKVEAELIEIPSGEVLWSMPLEAALKDPLEVQAIIAQKILAQFDHPSAVLRHETTNNFTAYAHYTRGNQLLESAYGDTSNYASSYQAVMDQYMQAIALDSGYVDAWADLIGVETFVYLNHPDSNQLNLIENHYQYFKDHFKEGWQRDLVEGHYHYRIARNYDLALHHMLKVLSTNPDNIHATYVASIIYYRKLETDLAITYALKQIRINPAHAGSWIHLSNLLPLKGDYSGAFQAAIKAWTLSKSKLHAEDVIIKAMQGNLYAAIPEEIKRNEDVDYTLWKLTMEKNWQELKVKARNSKNWPFLVAAFQFSGQLDSAIYYWSKHLNGDSASYYQLTHDKEKYFKYERKKQMATGTPDEDLLVKAYQQQTEIIDWLSFGDSTTAIQKLFEFRKNYPSFMDYGLFNYPFTKLVIDEHPKFIEVLNQVKPVSNFSITDSLTFQTL